jgi:hypothetical protein
LSEQLQRKSRILVLFPSFLQICHNWLLYSSFRNQN